MFRVLRVAFIYHEQCIKFRKCSEERFQGLKQEKLAVKDVVKVKF